MPPISAYNSRTFRLFVHEFLATVENTRTTLLVTTDDAGQLIEVPKSLLAADFATDGEGHRRQIAFLMRDAAQVTETAEIIAEELKQSFGEVIAYDTAQGTRGNVSSALLLCSTFRRMLFKHFRTDPLLRSFTTIVLAWPMDIHATLLLGLFQKIRKKRPFLRIVCLLSDATALLDYFRPVKSVTPERTPTTDALAPALAPVKVLEIPARDAAAPITRFLLGETCNASRSEVAAAAVLAAEPGRSTIVVHLPTQKEVDRFPAELQAAADAADRRGFFPLSLPEFCSPAEARRLALSQNRRAGGRLVVASVSAAPLGALTDVGVVVDSGLESSRVADRSVEAPVDRMVPISLERIARKSRQFLGERGGSFYCAWTAAAERELLPEVDLDDVYRTSVTQVVLLLLSIGGSDFLADLELPTPLPATTLMHAFDELRAYEAIDSLGRPTDKVHDLLELGLPVALANTMLLSLSEEFNCSVEISALVGMLATGAWPWGSGGSRLTREWRQAAIRSFQAVEGDMITCVNVYRLWEGRDSAWSARHCLNERALIRAKGVVDRVRAWMKRKKYSLRSANGDTQKVLNCIACGMHFDLLVHDGPRGYRLVRAFKEAAAQASRPAALPHPERSVYAEIVPPPYCVFYGAESGQAADFNPASSASSSASTSLTWLTNLSPAEPL